MKGETYQTAAAAGAFLGEVVPAPGLKGVAGSLVEVALHGYSISCICIEIHHGVIVGHVLKTFLLNIYQEHHLICLDEMTDLFLDCSMSLLHVPLLSGRIQDKLRVLQRPSMLELNGVHTNYVIHIFLNGSLWLISVDMCQSRF